MLFCGVCDQRILACAVCGDHAGLPALSAVCQRHFEIACEDAMIPRDQWHRVQHGEYRERVIVVSEPPTPVAMLMKGWERVAT